MNVSEAARPAAEIDLGVNAILGVSDDKRHAPAPPRHDSHAYVTVQRAHQTGARWQHGSESRVTVVHALHWLHQRIGNLRCDVHDTTARMFVLRFGAIGHDDAPSRGMTRSRRAPSTRDAAWESFLYILSDTAEEAGVSVMAVLPRTTTQAWSQCGTVPTLPATLAERAHRCSHYGSGADRDLNAAHRMGWLGSSRQDSTCADGRSVS